MKAVLAILTLAALSTSAANWPSWRGPLGLSISPEKKAISSWSATENVKWKIALPDRGNSSPIVYGNKVFITQPIEDDNKRLVICYDRTTGKELWRAGTDFGKEETHPTNPYASASPVTDGKHVYANFGSAGLFCFNMDGKQVWKKDVEKIEHQWGYAASPVLHKDVLIIYHGPQEKGADYLVGFDKNTGKELWRFEEPKLKDLPRTDGFRGRGPGIVGTWSTPLLIQAGGRDELIMSFPQQIVSLDPVSGKQLWFCEGLNPLIYTSPSFGDGLVACFGGFMGNALAVKPGGKGDVTSTHKVWEVQLKKNALGTPIIKDGHAYLLTMEGFAQCVSMKDGSIVWEERLRGKGPKNESWSTMVLVGDTLYAVNQSSDVILVKASPTFQQIGVNSIGNELTNSSLAISDGEIFLRTHKHLWCFGTPKLTASR